MVPVPDFIPIQRRHSVGSDVQRSRPSNKEVRLDVSNLPGSVPHYSYMRRASIGISVNVPGDEFVVECEEVGIMGSPSPSCDDGISMNYSLNSSDEGISNGGVFMTDNSAVLPVYVRENGKGKALPVSPVSFSNSIVGSSIGGGGGDDKKSFREGTPSISNPSLGAGDSKASLISLGKQPKDETWKSILSEIGLPFLIAGLGMVGAGLLLDYVMSWEVFVEVGELVVLVTPLLGLKGNLEMTLAARLSTHSNMGNLHKSSGNKWRICRGNLLLDQLQAIVCGFAASFIAILIGYLLTGKFDPDHMSIVVVSSILTASMVSLILGTTMVAVILLSTKFHINPDNVATPVAGSLGDVVTLGMLSIFSSIIYQWHNQGYVWVPYILIAFYAVCLPIFFWLAFRNEFTRGVTISGWIPLLVSVGISTGGGVLLDLATTRFPAVALYQPVINGIGGNLVSVQASRISSYLHGHCTKRSLPDQGKVCESPFTVFLGKGINSISARLLLLLAIPGHLLFSTVTHFVATNDETIYGPIFLGVYVSAAFIQVTILLYIAKLLTNLCWRRGIDPDTATIPYLTAMGDFLGSGLLFIAFELLSVMQGVPVST